MVLVLKWRSLKRMIEAFQKKMPIPIAIVLLKLGEDFLSKGDYVAPTTFIEGRAQAASGES